MPLPAPSSTTEEHAHAQSSVLAPALVIVVFGVSGCGKTTLGGALAQATAATFLDADDFHPLQNVEKMRAGIALDDTDRAPWLQRLNDELRARSEAGERVVLACSALKAAYRAQIGRALPQIKWVFLDGDFDVIKARLRQRENHYMPESLLRSQFAALERTDDAIAIAIGLPLHEKVNQVLAQLNR